MNIQLDKVMLNEMLELALKKHPYEIILLLRGKKDGDIIDIDNYLFPPFASSGRSHSSFPANMLPIDFSIMGTAHSHPTGVLSLSSIDMHNFYGRFTLLIGYPYREKDIAAFDKNGKKLKIQLIPG
jgi:proteasome lid subunit RPN8/RPN11